MPPQSSGPRADGPRRSLAAAVVACVLASLAACGGAEPEVASVGPMAPTAPILPHEAAHGALARPHVPAGIIFSARVNQPLDSETTPVGTEFAATVVDPLPGADGRVLVPYGATLTGVLVAKDGAPRPRMRVELRSIDTVAGRATLDATILSAQHIDFTEPPPPGERPPYGLLTDTPQRCPAPRVIHVPRGALLAVEVVEPIVVP